MKKIRSTETQIIGILKDQDSGIKIADICRKHGISDATFHNWKKRNGGLSVEELNSMKELELENHRLQSLVADLSLDNQILKEIYGKKW